MFPLILKVLQLSSAGALTTTMFIEMICTEMIKLEINRDSLVNTDVTKAQWFTRGLLKINCTETVNGILHFLPDT
jgi:hypothetical protein